MSQVAATQIPKPSDEQAFERACAVLFKCVLNDPNVQTNGRRGQSQYGVDIFGFRNQDAARPVGIQCKLKGPDKEVSENELRAEVTKALKFEPPLREFILVTTAPDDYELQRVARELTVQHSTGARQIQISVWGWQTVEQRIYEHGEAVQAFDPSHSAFAKQHSEQLQTLATQTSVVVEEIAHVRRDVGLLATNSLPGGSTVEKNVLEVALDAEIDQYRDVLNDGKPHTALKLYNSLLSRVQHTASGRILFRIKANLGHCHFVIGENARAAHWLIEAFAHAPSEPKAVANKALAFLLQDKFREAFDYGVKELEADPSNQWLPGYIIQAAARCPEIDNPLPSIPEPLRELGDVQATYVDFLRSRDRKPDWWNAARAAAAAHPDSKLLKQYKAEADLDEIGSDREHIRGTLLSQETKDRLESVVKTLSDIWDKRRESENPDRPDGVAVCCNLLAAYTALGQTEKALAVAKQAVALVPDDKELLARSAIVAVEEHDDEFTKQLLPKLEESPNALLVRFQFYSRTANWTGLVEVAKSAELVPEHDRVVVKAMGQLADLMMAGHDEQEKRSGLNALLEVEYEDSRAYVVICDFAAKLGFKEIADEAYKRALVAAARETSVLGRYMLARTAAEREDWQSVIQLLDHNVETNVAGQELSLLVTAFVNEDTARKRAVSFFKEIDQSVREMPFYLTAYGVLQSKRGDLPAAEKAFTRALTMDPADITALRSLYSVYLRQERSDRTALMATLLSGVELKRLKGHALDKMAMTHILRDIGEDQRALEWGYEIVRANRNDPDVVLGYFGLIMGRGDTIKVPRPTAVSIDTWVSLENELSEKQSVLIEIGPDKPADGIYSPTHAFVSSAIGLKVGETFVQNLPVGKPITWKVLAIKSKYLHVLHDMMETFNIQFPEAQGFYRVATREGDITPILDEVKSYSERSQNIIGMYSEKSVPLAVIAGMTHTSTIKFASGISQLGHNIVTCHGNEAERSAAERLVREHVGKGAVLDAYTAWAAEAIGVLPALKELFGTITVPRSAIDEIATIQHEFDDERQQMSVSYRDGQFYREELTRDDMKKRQADIAERRQKIEQTCNVEAVDMPDGLSEFAVSIIERSDPHVLDAPFLANETGKLLLSEDMHFRQVAQIVCGSAGAFLQAAITVGAVRKLLDATAHAEAIVGLAALRHSHVALTAVTLLQIAKIDDTNKQQKFRAVADFIGTETAEIYSHVNVSVTFLRGIWALKMPDLQREACSGILLEKLLRYRKQDCKQVVEVLKSELYGNFAATDYLARWLQGHFLNVA